MQTPFEHHVPRDRIANLKWRRKVYQRMGDDPSFATAIKQACALDPIFFFNAFCWTYDPRLEPIHKVPFILYDFQEEALLEILAAINHHDLLIEKSRDMGASWICIGAFFYRWLFRPMQSFLVGSRVDELVDSTGNPKAIFWRLDFLHNNLPPSLRPAGFNAHDHRTKRHLENPENHSVIDGETTTKDFGRGDRRTAILLDEFAMVEAFGSHICESTRPVTNCRLFNSTPNGTANAFHTMRQTNIKKLTLHWTRHPRGKKGLYTRNNNAFVPLDEEYWAQFDDAVAEMMRLDALIHAKNVPLPDGKKRSPWYANECDRSNSAREIAKEMDIDYGGSGGQWFNAELVDLAMAEFARPPDIIGDLEFDEIAADPIRFRKDPRGYTFLWTALDGDGNPILGSHRMIIGVDVSAGTGASNSCIVAYDALTHTKVLEVATPYMRPEAFAVLAVAIAKWLKKATHYQPFMIWEMNGPGQQFGPRILELGYTHIYMRANDQSIRKRVSDIPGWAPTKDSKRVLLGEYRAAIEGRRLANYSRCALEETLEYVHLPNGGVGHAKAEKKEDPSGASSNHGDRVMADALAWKAMHGIGQVPKKAEAPEAPIGSLAWRRKMREEQNRKESRQLTGGWRK